MINSSVSAADKLKITVLVILFVMLMFVISFLNARFPDMMLFGTNMTVSSFSGIITVIMILICTKILTINAKHGFKVSLILMLAELAMVSFAVIAKKNFQSATGIFMAIGGIALIVMQHSYLTTIEKEEQHLQSLSVTDMLTGLMNRRGLINKVDEYIAAQKHFTLFYLDLDNFKNINDSMGHVLGDTVLCKITNRWLDVMECECILARTGGDEFAVLVEDEDTANAVKKVQKCIDCLRYKITVDSFNYYVSVSIGAASFPNDADNSDDLIKHADAAMYRAKELGKNQLCIFDSDMLSSIKAEMQIESCIRDALKHNKFRLVFQPQYTAEDRKLRGFETLLRMNDANGKPVSPAVFIPIAEKSGLILDVDRWVLRNAIKTFSAYLDKCDAVLSINMSAKHITELNFTDEIEKVLDESGFPPERLEVEVTESCFISSVDTAVAALDKLKERGVCIALDDFGTGYASLSYLSRLPIDLVKIDKSFVDQLENSRDRDDFVKAIISIGHMFHCKVIAEGVELDSQLEKLGSMECDYIQGYLWGKPEPIENYFG